MDKVRKNILMRWALISVGFICVGLGIIGLFVPMMPGVVFLLIAAWCFARSSERFHDALLSHPQLGPQIDAWHSGKGFQRQLRTRILTIMWISMIVSMFIAAIWWVCIIIAVCGVCTTLYILKQPVYD